MATIELKNPGTHQTWRHAIRQYQNDRDPRAPLFDFKKRALVFFAAVAAVAALVSLPLLAWEVWAGRFFWPTPLGWLLLLYVGLMPSFVSQIMFIRGVELIGPARASVFLNLNPVFGPALAVLLLGEPLKPYHLLALAMVLGGIWIAERLGARPSLQNK